MFLVLTSTLFVKASEVVEQKASCVQCGFGGRENRSRCFFPLPLDLLILLFHKGV